MIFSYIRGMGTAAVMKKVRQINAELPHVVKGEEKSVSS